MLEQAVGINATNMEFLAWLRSKDQAIGSFNVAHGAMDVGLRKHAKNVQLNYNPDDIADKSVLKKGQEVTRGVVTNMTANLDDIQLKYVLDPDDIEDIKPVLKRMYTIKEGKQDQKTAARLITVKTGGDAYAFETEYVKENLLAGPTALSNRVELQFERPPKGQKWEGTTPSGSYANLKIGSCAYDHTTKKGDIDFLSDESNYDAWVKDYYNKCAKENTRDNRTKSIRAKGHLKVVTAWILASQNKEEHLLRPMDDFHAWTGMVKEKDILSTYDNTAMGKPLFSPYAHLEGTVDHPIVDCRMIVYFTNERFATGGWTFNLIGQVEKDMDTSNPAVERLIGPMLVGNDKLRDPISKVWSLKGNTGKWTKSIKLKDEEQNLFLPANPLVVGHEIALANRLKDERGVLKCKVLDPCNYMRYDATKSYSNPAAHLFWCHQDVEGNNRIEKMYKQFGDGWTFDLIRNTQQECVKRWNKWWSEGKNGPEPTSGYLGMVEFCEGATRTNRDDAPSQVIVCLTARTERKVKGDDKRISQARGVLATMQYANLLNPYSIESILQLKAGKGDTTSTTWDLCTKPFLGEPDFNFAFRGGGDVESFLSGPELHWSDLRGGGSGDLEGDFLRLSDMVPSSDEEGESEVSVLMEFDLGSRRPAFW